MKGCLLKYVLPLLSYLEFREEFPCVVNTKVNWQCTAANCNENPLDCYYDVTPRVYVKTKTTPSKQVFRDGS